jgi:hypothetical protein
MEGSTQDPQSTGDPQILAGCTRIDEHPGPGPVAQRPGPRVRDEETLTPLDPETRRRAELAIDSARRQGHDCLEELHRTGLLLTPAKELEQRIGGMEFLLRQITSWRPTEFLRRKFLPHHSCTPADMYSCMVEFIEEHIAAAKKGS